MTYGFRTAAEALKFEEKKYTTWRNLKIRPDPGVMILIKQELCEKIGKCSSTFIQKKRKAQLLTIFLKFDLLRISLLINCKCFNQGVVHFCYGNCLLANELGSLCVFHKLIGAASIELEWCILTQGKKNLGTISWNMSIFQNAKIIMT